MRNIAAVVGHTAGSWHSSHATDATFINSCNTHTQALSRCLTSFILRSHSKFSRMTQMKTFADNCRMLFYWPDVFPITQHYQSTEGNSKPSVLTTENQPRVIIHSWSTSWPWAKGRQTLYASFLMRITTTTRSMAFYPGWPGWVGIRRNTHSLTSSLFVAIICTAALINFRHFLQSTASSLHICWLGHSLSITSRPRFLWPASTKSYTFQFIITDKCYFIKFSNRLSVPGGLQTTRYKTLGSYSL